MRELRFGVQRRGRQGRRISGTYKLITGSRDDDVYLLRREAGSNLKLSLHPSGLSKLEYDGRAGGYDRPSRVEWALREPDDQGKIPIAIVYLSVALATRKPPAPKQDDSIVWIEAPSDAVLVEFQIWITEAARRLSLHDVELVGVLPLASGDRQIVVVAMPREAPPEMEFDLQFDGDAPGWVERARSAAPNLMLWTINNQICRIVDGAELHGPSTV